ncbi:2211_t:CDS:2, partial [Entrophospora sp. SA101]
IKIGIFFLSQNELTSPSANDTDFDDILGDEPKFGSHFNLVYSSNRKKRGKEKGARKRVGRKIDGIIYNIGKNLELGVFESANIFKDEHDNKYLKETL